MVAVILLSLVVTFPSNVFSDQLISENNQFSEKKFSPDKKIVVNLSDSVSLMQLDKNQKDSDKSDSPQTFFVSLKDSVTVNLDQQTQSKILFVKEYDERKAILEMMIIPWNKWMIIITKRK